MHCTPHLPWRPPVRVLKPAQTQIPSIPSTQPASPGATETATLPVEPSSSEFHMETNNNDAEPPLFDAPGHVETKLELVTLKEEQAMPPLPHLQKTQTFQKDKFIVC